jgi:hypothetical protein
LIISFADATMTGETAVRHYGAESIHERLFGSAPKSNLPSARRRMQPIALSLEDSRAGSSGALADCDPF